MKQHFQHWRRSAAFTLVEMMVAVAVLGVILAVAIPSLTDLIERRRVIAAAGEISSIFAQARSEANSLNETVKIHLNKPASGETSCIRMTISFGVVSPCSCKQIDNQLCKDKLLREYLAPPNSPVSFEATGTWNIYQSYAVTFRRDARLTDVQDVAVTVKGAKTGAKLRVEYNDAGRVRTCSPDGSITGYPVCS